MKHVIAFATISACLVLSGGAALAGNPVGTGEPGNNPTITTGPNGANCGNLPAGLPSTGATNSSNPGSPFNASTTPGTSGGHYAGAGANTNSQANLANAYSNYDVACFQVNQPH